MPQQDAKHDNLPIPAYKFLAVEQRYLGATSKQIALKLWEGFEVEVHPGTVRNWFAQSGELREMYDEYASEMNEERVRLAKDYFKANTLTAAKVLMAVMQGHGGMAQVAAAKVFLDRGLGKVVKDNQPIKEEPQTLRDVIELIH